MNDGAIGTSTLHCPQSPYLITIEDDDENSEILGLHNELRRLRAENDDYKKQVITLQSQCVENQNKIESLKNTVKANEIYHAKELQNKLEEVKEQRINNGKLENCNKELDEQVDHLQKEMDEVKLKLTEKTEQYDEEKNLYEKTASDLANATNENETERQENSKLAELLQTSREEVNKLEKEYKQSTNELETQLQNLTKDDQVLLTDSNKIMELYEQLYQQLEVNDDGDTEITYSGQADGDLNEDASSCEIELQRTSNSISKDSLLPKHHSKAGPTHKTSGKRRKRRI